MTRSFLKYPHLERFGTPDVEGIEVGQCWVFPKIDGTNASVWADMFTETFAGDKVLSLHCGSRTRDLTVAGAADNFGFRAWVESQGTEGAMEPLENLPALTKFFMLNSTSLRLYGEWLVPHTFKHYREETWRRFWVFDVYDDEAERFLSFEEYMPLLDAAGLDFVTPIATVKNPTQEQLIKIAEGNTFLVQDGAGPGEGVVIKRYDFVNRFGRTTWAKVVRNEFKEKATLAMGIAERGETFQVEVAMAEAAVTPALVAKERSKIENALLAEEANRSPDVVNDYAGTDWERKVLADARGQLIPRLLETVYHCVVTEELWPQLKKHKNPTVDFKKLRQYVIAQTKRYAKDLF